MDELIYTAHQGTNAEMFRQILRFYFTSGTKLIDTTYGRGTR